MRRILLAAALVTAVLVAGCDIAGSSTGYPPAPTPGASEQPARVVDLADREGVGAMTLRIYDRSFALTNARSATPAELADAEDLGENVIGAFGSGRELLVTWAGSTCPDTGNLFIGPGVDAIVLSPTVGAGCDATDNLRGVVLEFKLAVDLKAIRFDLRPMQAAATYDSTAQS
jgi:hypothetical protein